MIGKDTSIDPNNPDDIGNSEILLKAVRDYEKSQEEEKRVRTYEYDVLLELISKIDYSTQTPLTKTQVDEFIERTKGEYSKKFVEPIVNLGNNGVREYLPPSGDSTWYVIGYRWIKRDKLTDRIFIQNKILGEVGVGIPPHCFGIIPRLEDINLDEMVPWGFGFLSTYEAKVNEMMAMCCYLCGKAGCPKPLFWKGNSSQSEVIEVLTG